MLSGRSEKKSMKVKFSILSIETTNSYNDLLDSLLGIKNAIVFT